MRKVLPLLAIFVLSGCASYTPYKEQLPRTSCTVSDVYLVSVVDQRRRVAQGKDKSFAGVHRVNFGIPISKDVDDLSPNDPLDKNKTLAEFLERRLVDGMKDSGCFVSGKPLVELPASREVESLLHEEGATKWLILVLNEWYFSIDMHFINSFNFDSDVDVHVYSNKSDSSLIKSMKTRDVVQETSNRHNDVLFGYKSRLSKILNDREVNSALQK